MNHDRPTAPDRPSRPRAMRQKMPVVAMGVAGLALVIGGAVFTPVSAQEARIQGKPAAPTTQWTATTPPTTPPGAEFIGVKGDVAVVQVNWVEAKPATQPTTVPAPVAAPKK